MLKQSLYSNYSELPSEWQITDVLRWRIGIVESQFHSTMRVIRLLIPEATRMQVVQLLCCCF